MQLSDSCRPPHQYNPLEKSGPQEVRYYSNNDIVYVYVCMLYLIRNYVFFWTIFVNMYIIIEA